MSENKAATHSDDLMCPRQYIFVDPNVLIPMFTVSDASGLDALHALSQVGRAHLLTTDITRIETVKNFAEKDCDIIRPVDNDRFRERVRELMNIRLPAPVLRRAPRHRRIGSSAVATLRVESSSAKQASTMRSKWR